MNDSVAASELSRPSRWAARSLTTSTSLPMKNRLPALVQTRGGRGAAFAFSFSLSSFSGSFLRGLNDMERQAVERFGRDLGAGIFGLLGSPGQDFLHFLLVLARVGDEHAGHGELGIVATDGGDRQGPSGSSNSSLMLTPIRSLSALATSSSFWPARPGSP